MKHVPTFRSERFAAQEFITGGAPNIGRDVKLRGEHLLSAQRLAQQRTAAENMRLKLLSFGRRLQLVQSFENSLFGAMRHFRHLIVLVVECQIIKILFSFGIKTAQAVSNDHGDFIGKAGVVCQQSWNRAG